MSENYLEDKVPLSPERLLAATMMVYGKIEIPVDYLVADYSRYQISVNQERDGYVIFELVNDDEAS